MVKTKGISIILRTEDTFVNDVIWSKELFSTKEAVCDSVITENVLTDVDSEVSFSPGGETPSMEDSSLPQTQSDTQ